MADWYASPTGDSGNDGSLGSPWDLESALVNTTDIDPGDTLWLLEGMYVHPDRGASTFGYKVGLQGASGNSIVVRPHDNGHVTIDGGLHSNTTAPVPQYVTIRDLEVIVSENLTLSRVSDTNGSTPTYAELDRPWGGVELQAGVGLKLVNCVIHANAQGVGFWNSVTDSSELYGNIIYDNGWLNPNGSPHGHGIYSQNTDPENKFIRNNILIANYSFNLHAYGSGSSHVENYTLEDNISSGGPRGQSGTIRNFMLGNENSSSNFGHTVSRNRLWHSNMRLGYNQPVDSVTLEDNMIVLSDLEIYEGSTNVTQSGNFNWGEDNHGATCDLEAAPRNGASTPSGPEVFITANTYDSARAHIAVYNYFLDDEVDIDLSGFLTNGQDFYLLDPTDFYGSPVYANTYEGSPLAVPTGGKMFVAFVAIQDDAQQPVVVPSSGFMW